MMRINWVFAETYQIDPVIDIDAVKNVGPTWGSWRTWRSCATDNVICYDYKKAQELLTRAFQSVCNFYVPKKHYQDLNRPMGVKLFEGDFEQEVAHKEDIVALHIIAPVSDIVLMLGFDLGTQSVPSTNIDVHRLKNYHGMINSVIRNHPDVQWVLIDHDRSLDKAYQNLPNLTVDNLENALKLLH